MRAGTFARDVIPSAELLVSSGQFLFGSLKIEVKENGKGMVFNVNYHSCLFPTEAKQYGSPQGSLAGDRENA